MQGRSFGVADEQPALLAVRNRAEITFVHRRSVVASGGDGRIELQPGDTTSPASHSIVYARCPGLRNRVYRARNRTLIADGLAEGSGPAEQEIMIRAQNEQAGALFAPTGHITDAAKKHPDCAASAVSCGADA